MDDGWMMDEWIDHYALMNIIKYFEKLITIVETLRQGPGLQDSFIQNEIDNVTKLLYSTRYKLVNLQ